MGTNTLATDFLNALDNGQLAQAMELMIGAIERDEARYRAAVQQSAAPGSVYGSATVQEEVLDWYVEPRCADWEAVGPQFEVDSNGDVMKL